MSGELIRRARDAEIIRPILGPVACRDATCALLGVDPEILRSRSRSPGAVEARRAVWLLMRRHGLSYEEIARASGRSSHSTIINALRAVDGRRRIDAGAPRMLTSEEGDA